MKYVNINNTELNVSCVCLGTAQFASNVSEDIALEILDRFAEGGGTFIDTANVYGRWHPGGLNVSERLIGKWLKSRGLHGKMVVATKAAHYDLHTPHIMRLGEDEIRWDLDESRETLGIDKIDLLWLHRDDVKRPIGEIIDTMESLVDEGLIRYYGASNFTPSRIAEAQKYAAQSGRRGFSAISNHWNPTEENLVLHQKTDPTLVNVDDLTFYKECGLSFIPYNATAKGFFQKFANGDIYSEKYTRLREKYLNQKNIDLCDSLIIEAEQNGISVQTQLLRRIISADFQIIPITSVSSAEQVNDILAV